MTKKDPKQWPTSELSPVFTPFQSRIGGQAKKPSPESLDKLITGLQPHNTKNSNL